MKHKIQEAYLEPRAPEELVSAVILRAQAVTMGEQAKKQLEAGPTEEVRTLAAQALIGQLAMVSPLPYGAEPEELAQQLQHESAFTAALCGGNVLRRIQSGELMQQLANQPTEARESPEAPKIDAPVLSLEI